MQVIPNLYLFTHVMRCFKLFLHVLLKAVPSLTARRKKIKVEDSEEEVTTDQTNVATADDDENQEDD
jgi:hypothetical protein